MKKITILFNILFLLTFSANAEVLNQSSTINKCRDLMTDHVEYKAMPCVGNTQEESITVYGGTVEGSQAVHQRNLQYRQQREAKRTVSHSGGGYSGSNTYQDRLKKRNQGVRQTGQINRDGRNKSGTGSGTGGSYNPVGESNSPRGERNPSR